MDALMFGLDHKLPATKTLLDDTQAMSMVKKYRLAIGAPLNRDNIKYWYVAQIETQVQARSLNLNEAIYECVLELQNETS